MLWTFPSLTSRSLRLCTRWKHPRSFTSTPYYKFPRVQGENVLKSQPLPTFREQVARSNVAKSFREEVRHPSIKSQVLFVTFGTIFVFAVAAERTNYDTLYWSQKLAESGNLIWKFREPTSDELRRAKYYEFGKQLQAGLITLKSTVEQWPETIKAIAIWTYVQVAQPILDTTEGRRVCWAIGAVNTLVWLAWQFPRMQPFMMKHFTHNPLSGLSYTLLTSIFSHKSIIHLAANSMALASFGSAASQHLKREQSQSPTGLPESTVKWHFLAFYVSAGLFSGLVSHVVSARFRYPAIISQLMAKTPQAAAVSSLGETTVVNAAAAATPTILPSLGASGAIYATVTLTALAFPDTEIALLIPPTFPIPIQWGVSALVTLDLIGAWRRWRLFDHWAHLGGAAFGVFYYQYGGRIWDFFRVVQLPPPKRKDA